MSALLIYGANGYTGRLIAAEAKRRGMDVILAGRSGDALRSLGSELDLPVRVFSLDDADVATIGLSGVSTVLHCAGPFSQTCALMLEACLVAGVHYLDITGEIEVFGHCHRQHERAIEAGIVVLPGSGFDVVPTDGVAALLKQRLPDATHLVLAFEAAGGPSPGTAKTSIEGLAAGGRARIDGELKRVPLAWKSRTFERDGQARLAMTIPWGDVYTAHVSTGIPNIETYMTVPPATLARMRRLRRFQPFLGLGFVQRLMKRRVDAAVRGPSGDRRAKSGSHVWGEVRNARGDTVKLQLVAPNGYDITVTAALGIAEHVMRATAERGYYTPSLLMGADYVLSLPGTRLVETASS